MTFQRDPNVIRHCVGRCFEHVTTVLTFEQEIKIQAHREAWGSVLSMETFVECEHEHGAIVIFLNDCSPALAGFRKGSDKHFVQNGLEIIHELCKHSSKTELTTALAPRFRVFRGQHALMSCGQKYKYLHTAWGIRGSQPSTCSPQHATPDADASAPGHQIKGLSKWTRLRCDRGTTARVQAASVGIVSAVYTRYQTVWPIPWSDGLARTGPEGYSRCLQISRPAIYRFAVGSNSGP